MNQDLLNERIDTAVRVLKNGGVIAHATDTCYGFACDAFNKEALAKLYALKDMAATKPVSILVSDTEEAKKYAEFSESADVLAQQYWPGALTLVMTRKETIPDFLNPESATVGIRVPDHTLSRELARRLGRPITTTSANVSGMPSPYTTQEIAEQFKNRSLKPDFVIEEGELSSANLPSTIIDVTQSPLKIIRQGSLFVAL